MPDYELLYVIGHGSYGEVWLARNLTGSLFALKIVRRDAFDHSRPFEREFEGIKRFEPISRSDPSQVAILHVGRGEGFYYYVMELGDDASTSSCNHRDHEIPSAFPAQPNKGLVLSPAIYTPRTLQSELHTRDRLPISECIKTGLSLTRALAHLHRNGLVHRDVKPSNIVFVNGLPKLADIGLVAAVDATLSFVGTSGFLPPEGPGAPQGDLYSLGKVLYEISTGKDRHDFPKLPPDFGEREDRQGLLELNAVILKACATRPADRYQSAQEMHTDLASLERGKSVRKRQLWRKRLRFGLTGFVIAVAGLAAALLFGRVLPARDVLSKKAAVNEKVVQGDAILRDFLPERVELAAQRFRDAIALDPTFAPAHFGLFVSLMYRGAAEWDADGAARSEIRRVADNLMKIDPSLAESQAARAMIEWND